MITSDDGIFVVLVEPVKGGASIYWSRRVQRRRAVAGPASTGAASDVAGHAYRVVKSAGETLAECANLAEVGAFLAERFEQ